MVLKQSMNSSVCSDYDHQPLMSTSNANMMRRQMMMSSTSLRPMTSKGTGPAGGFFGNSMRLQARGGKDD